MTGVSIGLLLAAGVAALAWVAFLHVFGVSDDDLDGTQAVVLVDDEGQEYLVTPPSRDEVSGPGEGSP